MVITHTGAETNTVSAAAARHRFLRATGVVN